MCGCGREAGIMGVVMEIRRQESRLHNFEMARGRNLRGFRERMRREMCLG